MSLQLRAPEQAQPSCLLVPRLQVCRQQWCSHTYLSQCHMSGYLGKSHCRVAATAEAAARGAEEAEEAEMEKVARVGRRCPEV